jgi:uncharacterized membrane protein
MIEVQIFTNTLILATLGTTLTAGLVFAFAIVAMPGIKQLNDREFIRAFQAMDGIIQNNPPLFVFVWVGSVAALLLATALGIRQLDGAAQWLIIGAAVTYLLGVQLPTITINIPLNNELQRLDTAAMDAAALNMARKKFEPRWNRWNVFRAGMAILASVMLMVLLVII